MNNKRPSSRGDIAKRFTSIYRKLNQGERQFLLEFLISDPLRESYAKFTLAYLLIMSAMLLWPFDFALTANNNAQWIKDPAGISFPDDGQVLSDSPTQSLFKNIQKGSGLSVEVWIASKNVDQTGPARIISYSLNTRLRNFTLGQSFDQLIFRLRTTKTDLNGVTPHLVVDGVFLGTGRLHIVVTYDFAEQLVFINGELRKKTNFLTGSFSNWDSSHKLVLGNEIDGGRPWIGEIHYAAIYNRPLRGPEVQRNYQLGLDAQMAERVDDNALQGISARYLFDELNGDRILNRVNGSNSLHLTIPKSIRKKDKHYLSFPERIFTDRHTDHFIMNIMIFVPLGFLVHAVFRNRYGNAAWVSLASAVAGVSFSFTAESLQYMSLTRVSSSFDLIANSMGVVAGVICDRVYANLLRGRAMALRNMGNSSE